MHRIRIASLLLTSTFAVSPLVVRAADSASAPAATSAAAPTPAMVPTEVAPVELAAVTVYSPDVANQDPVSSYATPVSVLRFEPLVDVQARSFAEAQSDISIRGGTFESTGFKIGALSIYDPQTGHYTGELPVAPAMLSAPTINTGADNAINGWSSTAGSIAYGWNRISGHGFVSAGGGDNNLLRAEAYSGYVSDVKVAGRTLAADASVAYSESDGTRPFGDHEFARYNARIQLANDSSQTDLFAGYQDKFIGWRELYAGPFNLRETDDLQTTLIALNHRVTYGADGDYFQAGAYYRRNDDEYQSNRFAPNTNFIHRTEVGGASFDGRFSFTDTTALRYRAGVTADTIDSTSLFVGPTNGRYDDRTQGYAGVFADHTVALSGNRSLVLTAGANYDDSNRSGSAVSPVVEVSLNNERSAFKRIYVSYAEATQLPGYTALNSNSAAGFFRGDRDLGRSESKNLELGAETAVDRWTFKTAVFFRKDDNLVDWTYNPAVPTAARIAAQGDTDTFGFEGVARRSFDRIDLVLGYSWLHKTEDYLAAGTDSFYAFNFPVHRVTAAIVARLGAGFEARMDNEFRVQEDNSLRRRNNDVVLSSLGLYYTVPGMNRRLTLSAQVDNLWNTYYEEVPLVPGSPRDWSLGARYAW